MRSKARGVARPMGRAWSNTASCEETCLVCAVQRCLWASLGSSAGKESACNAGDPGSIPGSGRSLGEEMATHSGVLAWKIPWTEEFGAG